MSIRTVRRRGGPIYRLRGGEVISIVPETVVREIRLLWRRYALFCIIEKAAYIIDGRGVRRVRRRIRLSIGHR
jgi:hypothetical protein